VPAARYRYDDDHPEAAIKDLFLSDGPSGYEHPALYRLAERVVSCPACGATRGIHVGRRVAVPARHAPGAITPRTRNGASRQLSA
jgi:hypothetical protein